VGQARGTSKRVALVAALIVSLLLVSGCEYVVSNGVDTLRASAALPTLPVNADLTAAARAKSADMCAAGAVSASPDPMARYGAGAAVAVQELVDVAPLDAADSNANGNATQAIWGRWKALPTLIDPRWEEQGVGEVTCADGKLYMTLVLRDDPTPGVRADGKTWLFMGQELGAVGGFPNDHDQGYADYVGTPAGVTIYTDLRYPVSLTQRVNFGGGDLCGQCYLDNPRFDDAMIAIGLYLVGDLGPIVAGARDANITTLGNWIKAADRPVFLRIGYEFDGSWNAYDPALYIQAFRRIMNRLQANGVTNVISVWQGSGSTTNPTTLLKWYPGDAYVDWLGYSYFRQSNPSGGIMQLARQKNKPVMIAEATPQRNLSLGDPVEHWNAWFQPFFEHVHANADMIKAVAYINTRWFDQPEWNAGWGDSRVQIRPEIKASWIAEMQSGIWAPGDLSTAANTYVLTEHDLTPPG
jgi:hypothetical protein